MPHLNLNLNRNLDRESLVEPQQTVGPRVAVVLNGNARAVNSQLITDLRGLLQDESLYVSHSLEQSKFIARHIVHNRYDVVLCGGGDGTLTHVVSDIDALRPDRMPAFGVLRLGTGNAMAFTLGAGHGLRGIANDLRVARRLDARTPFSLLRVERRLTPFVGVGLDSMILDDYHRTLSSMTNERLKALCAGPLGYGLSIATRSLWRYVTKPLPCVTIRNEGDTAWRIDSAGRAMDRPIDRGQVIYSGPVTIAAASTIPYFGFGFRAFPQAQQRPGRFQLRVSRMKAASILGNLPALFRGQYVNEEALWDFACSRVSISSEQPVPFQIGGDAAGQRQQVTIDVQQLQGVNGSKAMHPTGPEAASGSLSIAS